MLDVCTSDPHLRRKRGKLRPKCYAISLPLFDSKVTALADALSPDHPSLVATLAQACWRRQVLSSGFTNILINIRVQMVKRENEH